MADTFAGASGTDSDEPVRRKRRGGVRWWWALVFLAMAALVWVPIWYASLFDVKTANHGEALLPSESPALPNQAEAPKKHAEKAQIEHATFFHIDGKDAQGHPAAFDFIVLSNQFAWVKGSTSAVTFGDDAVPEAETAERLVSPQVREALNSATDLIAIGLASQEGERTQEEARAQKRAITVSGWIAEVVKPEMAIWTLTLGQYDKACKGQEDADSSFERPVLLAGVRSKSDGVNLREALADAVSDHDNLPSRECYSRFDLEKVR